jgi:hypothetical protein
MEKQTPVEWLALRYHHRQGYLSQDDIAEAKEMERQHIIKAFDDGYCSGEDEQLTSEDIENYYKETYGK